MRALWVAGATSCFPHGLRACCAVHCRMQRIGRFVACVHTAHVAAQVTKLSRCSLSVVLIGFQAAYIGADWSDDEADEFCVAALH
jgi:hypothetical protein